MLRRCLIIFGPISFLIVMLCSAQGRLGQLNRGGEWLSWSPEQRTTYVNGFLMGYATGSHEACDLGDQIFEVGKQHRLGDEHHPSELPSARCLARIDKYSSAKTTDSGIDYGPYTDTITEFYRKYPEYQGVPFFKLLKSLSDSKVRTADELYRMALKGELRPLR